VLRSKNIYDPYEDKIVLEQGSTPINGPHQGALVDTAAGEWWFVHFQEDLPYGRIIHLQPVQWKDGWPLMGARRDGNGVGEPVLTFAKPKVSATQPLAVPQTSDDFDDKKLGLQWQWHANHRDDWCSLGDRAGWLRLIGQPLQEDDLAKSPNLLLQKFPAKQFTVETLFDAGAIARGSRAGLVIMGKKHAALAIERDNDTLKLVLRLNNQPAASEVISSSLVRLKISMRTRGLCTFAYAIGDGPFRPFSAEFQAVEGVWIGAKVGVFCGTPRGDKVECHADFDYFRFSPV